ncbi:MAG: nucleotidyltransferase family protein [Caldilineaceae bacterium]
MVSLITDSYTSGEKCMPALWWSAFLLGSANHALTAPQLSPQAFDWEALIATARSQHLASLLYWRLRALPLAVQPPATVMERLRPIYTTEAVNSLLHIHELRTVLSALNQVGIHPTLFKGAALAHTVYPVPVCRPMGDLDLWLTAAEMPTAQAVIESLGYTQKPKATRPLVLQKQQDGEVQLLGHPPRQGLIELHWGVFAGAWLQHVAEIDRDAVFQRRVPVEILGAPVYVLSNEDAVIQLAIHLGINHQLSLHPLRSLVDIAFLDQQGVDWEMVVERACAWRLVTVVGAILALLVNIFGAENLTPGVSKAAAALSHSRLRRLLTDHWVNPAVVLNQQQIRASRHRFFYLLSMTDHLNDVLKLLTHTLWPGNGWLTLRYGQVNWSVRLRHLTAALSGDI